MSIKRLHRVRLLIMIRSIHILFCIVHWWLQQRSYTTHRQTHLCVDWRSLGSPAIDDGSRREFYFMIYASRFVGAVSTKRASVHGNASAISVIRSPTSIAEYQAGVCIRINHWCSFDVCERWRYVVMYCMCVWYVLSAILVRPLFTLVDIVMLLFVFLCFALFANFYLIRCSLVIVIGGYNMPANTDGRSPGQRFPFCWCL